MRRLAMVLVAAGLGTALLFSGGCCHMHRHHGDRGGCGDCSCCNKQQPCCDKGAAAEMPCKNAEGCPKADKK